jgi:hypothetical protein
MTGRLREGCLELVAALAVVVCLGLPELFRKLTGR